jgi:hypothetical protein
MKKVRVLLQVLAVVFAAGSAFAFSASPNTLGYIKVSGSPFCRSVSHTCGTTGPACQINADIVYDGSTIDSSSCGLQLGQDQ